MSYDFYNPRFYCGYESDDSDYAYHRYRRCRASYPIRDILYTKTNVPVYTLYVTNLNPKDNKKTIKNIFAEFGVVRKVDIITEHRRYNLGKNFRYAFVTFEDSDSVARAIRRRSSIRLKIKFADDWKQFEYTPNLKAKQCNYPQIRNWFKSLSIKNQHEPSDHFNILNLNDDCLFHIIKFLSLEDRLNLSKISPHLLYLCSKSSRKLITSNYKNLNTLREAFITFGSNLTTISVTDNIRILSMLPAHCFNLKVLSLNSLTSRQNHFHIDKIKRLICKLKNLESISMSCVSLNDDILFEMSNLVNLKMLALTQVGNIKGKHLEKCVNLTRLKLKNIYSLKSEYFTSFLKIVKLKELSFTDIILKDDVYDAIFEFQSELEELTIDTSYNCSHLKKITTLQNLKKLCLSFKDDVHFQGQRLCFKEEVNVDFLCDIHLSQFRNKDLKIFCGNPSFHKIVFRNINDKRRKIEVRTISKLSEVKFLILT